VVHRLKTMSTTGVIGHDCTVTEIVTFL
jgi:hypothetical protein